MVDPLIRPSSESKESKLVPGSLADTAATNIVAKYALLMQIGSLVLFVVIERLLHNSEQLDILFYAHFLLGLVASITGLLAAVILRRPRWLLVPIVVVIVACVQLWYVVTCCSKWAS